MCTLRTASRTIMHGLLLATLVLSAVARAQMAKNLPLAPGVVTGKLANGLTYYILQNKEPRHRAELRLVVNAGSILETGQQRGLAHFAEHMAFNGTKYFQKQELVHFLEKSGVRFGADLNAYTSFDETVYELQLPTDSPHVYQTGFQVLEDWAHQVSFEPAEIDKERGVVIEEWRLGQGAEERMRAKYFPVLLKGSMYAQRLPIGTHQNLQQFAHRHLIEFYRNWYRPDLQAVIVVGDVDVEATRQLIHQHFAHIPRKTRVPPRTRFTIPAQPGLQVSVVTDGEHTYNSIELMYLQPAAGPQKTVGDYRTMLVRQLFNTMMGARLNELAHRPSPPFLMAASGYSRFYGDKDVYSLFATAATGKQLLTAGRALMRENHRVLQHGFTLTELKRARTELLESIQAQYHERNKTTSAWLVNGLVEHHLQREAFAGIEMEYRLHNQYLPGIALAEVNAMVKKWVRQNNRVVLVMAPDSEKPFLPMRSQLIALANKKPPTLAAWTDEPVMGSLLPVPPVPGVITRQQYIDSLQVTVWTLGNGATVVLKPTDFKNNEVVFAAIGPGGTSRAGDSNYLSAATASSLVFNSGAGNYNQVALQKYLTGKQMFVAPGLSIYMHGISAYATSTYLPAALELMHAYFTHPRRDTLAFTNYLQQMQADLANKGNDPASVFGDSVAFNISGRHYRSRPLTAARLREINLDTALHFYRQTFGNAAGFVFTFAGSFKVDSLRPLVEKYIASLPAQPLPHAWRDVGMRYPDSAFKKVIVKGKDKKSNVRLTFTGLAQYSELEATQLSQLCQVLSIQLRQLLREDEGGVYGVGVRGGINREPVGNYAISIAFGCAPENVDKLIQLVFNEIDSLKTRGADSINIQKVKAEGIRNLETQVKENNYWLYQLQNAFFRGQNPIDILEAGHRQQLLNINRTRQLANQYFDTSRLVQFILMPEP